MSEENTNNEEQESQQEPQEKTPENKSEDKSGDIKERVSNIEKEVYEKRKSELSDIEKRIDKKMSELRSVVEEAESQGITSAGKGKKSQEEIDQEEADNIVKSMSPE
jgi:hypothetical protein